MYAVAATLVANRAPGDPVWLLLVCAPSTGKTEILSAAIRLPWVIPAGLLDTFIIAYPSKRYRSALIGIAVHSAQSVFFLVLVLSLVLKG